MAIGAMQETRRRGDSKRLEAVRSLITEAGDVQRLSSGRRMQLINTAVDHATGLNLESSRRTFRSECGLVLDTQVAPHFDAILDLSEKIWNDRSVNLHSRYHVVMKICKLLKGRMYIPGVSITKLMSYYSENICLLP